MQIQLPPTLTVAAPARVGAPAGWAVNQLLTAEVIGASGANCTRLRIGTETLTAVADMRLLVGQKLALRVTALAPQPTLQVIATQAPPAPTAPTAAALARGLARALPRQASAAQSVQVFNQLARAAGAHAAAAVAAPRQVPAARLAAREVVRTWPDVARVTTPGGLASVVNAARLPTEARLHIALETRTEPALSGDLRAQLGRLQLTSSTAVSGSTNHPAPPSTLRQPAPAAPTSGPPTQAPAAASAAMPGATSGPAVAVALVAAMTADEATSRELVDSVLARQTVQHLHNLVQQHAAGSAAAFAVEIPLHHANGCDLLQFDYTPEEPAASDDDGPRRAAVRIVLTLDDGRAIQAGIRLVGDALSMRLGASDALLAAAIAADLDELRACCAEEGLNVRELVVSTFDVAARGTVTPRYSDLPLVDTRA